jgi:hypothetical protein
VRTKQAATPGIREWVNCVFNNCQPPQPARIVVNGQSYPIQAASNLNPVIFWTNVGSGTGDARGLFRFIDVGASNRSMRYYRAVSP